MAVARVVRHRSWPFWRASPHRALAHASAARNRLAPPHRRCTRSAQVPAESAEVEATDVARSAARQTVKAHGPSRRPGRFHRPNSASRRGSKQAVHSLAHLVLLSLASGFRIPPVAPVTSDGSCSGGSCGLGRRQLSVGSCDKCDEDCGPCNGKQGGGGSGTHCSKSCNHHPSYPGTSCSGLNHDSGLGPRNDGPCNAATLGDCTECEGDQDCDDDLFGGSWCIAWCDAGCNQGCTNDCDTGCDAECDEGCSCSTDQWQDTGATNPRHSSPVPPPHHHHRLSRHHARPHSS